MKIIVLVNPGSGRGHNAHVVKAATDALVSDGHDVQCIDVASLKGAQPVLDSETILVIAGGDGTVHHALPTAARSGCAVYQLPLGTENLFAREFGMSREPLQLRRAVQRYEVRSIDLGEANGRLFSLMCSVGSDAAVVHAVSGARSGPISKLKYVGPAIRQFVQPVPALRVIIDGNLAAEEPGMVVIANSRQYGARLNPARDAQVDDAQLDVVFFPGTSGRAIVWWMLKSRFGRHTRDPRLIYRAATTVRIESLREPVPCQIDGEAAGFVGVEESGSGGFAARAGLEVSLRPRALRVLVPPL